MSGAGRIKQDASDDTIVVEIKDANKTFTLSAKDLFRSYVQAVQEGKEVGWVIQFRDPAIRVFIRVEPQGPS